MGNVSSRPDELLYQRDQNRLSVVNVKIQTSNQRVLYNIFPNNFPATRYLAQKETDDDGIVEFVQDQETIGPNSSPNFLLKLTNDEDITFYFTLALRKDPAQTVENGSADTVINNLTFLRTSTPKEMSALITREFNADPNIHRNPNVDLVGDYSTAGKPSDTFEWSWTWRPPKPSEDRGGGWRNTCSFVEYDQRAHRLNTLVTFSFWVHSTKMQFPSADSNAKKFKQDTAKTLHSPRLQSPKIELTVPQRSRVPSSQSIDSRMSDSDTDMSSKDVKEPSSPTLGPTITAIPEDAPMLEPTMTAESMAPSIKLDLMSQRQNDDFSAVEDGPLFRSTMKQLENKTGSMKSRMKNVIERAKILKGALEANNAAYTNFIQALRETSSSNANAVKPALENYFENIATQILDYEEQNVRNLSVNIIDPLSRIYRNDIKMVETKKDAFDKESKEFYNYVGRYLGQRSDSLKEKKKAEEDSKYQSKRRTFELKRFDYSSFMQDLHGGRKDQEVLSQLTRFADAQARSYLATGKKIESMMPQLEALSFEVKEADKEYALMRTGREEKRRALEKGEKSYGEPQNNGPVSSRPDMDLGISGLSGAPNEDLQSPPVNGNTTDPLLVAPPRTSSLAPSSRDVSGNYSNPSGEETSAQQQHRKEGLLWSLSRPGSHVDPRGLNKQSWHKFWIVLDQGKLCEYVNWKQNLEPHMDPIDLRVASVREARSAERRFCFEVITPNFTRVYQATGEDDMRSWIQAINNALQSAFEGQSGRTHPAQQQQQQQQSSNRGSSIARDLFGKSSSFHGHRSTSSTNYLSAKNISRHATVPDRPPLNTRRSSEEQPARLLQTIRAADAGNAWCADCGSESRVEWVSINLGIIVCIECSGIHRSLGTHISKIRSLTLDTASFTQDVVELLSTIGNRVSNMIWEANLDQAIKPRPSTPREQRLQFITAKYVQKTFVKALPTTGAVGPDETLLTSIKRNDIQHVIHALALGANPNVTDKSRSTPGVFLALAAADPAAPNTGSSSPAARPASASGAVPLPAGQRKSFPIAELLVQNGANVPDKIMATIPLTKDAVAYLDLKMAQKLGKLPVASSEKSGAGSAAASVASPGASPSMARVYPSDERNVREGGLAKRVSVGSERNKLVKNPLLR